MKNMSFITNSLRTIRQIGIVKSYGPLRFDTRLHCRVQMKGYNVGLSMTNTKDNL